MDITKQTVRLQEMKQELVERVARTHRHLHQREERVSGDFSEQSQEMENQELVYNLDQEGREELKMIDDALALIESGGYGECQSCGKGIDDARMNAVPYTKLCIGCAAEMES